MIFDTDCVFAYRGMWLRRHPRMRCCACARSDLIGMWLRRHARTWCCACARSDLNLIYSRLVDLNLCVELVTLMFSLFLVAHITR